LINGFKVDSATLVIHDYLCFFFPSWIRQYCLLQHHWSSHCFLWCPRFIHPLSV